MVVTAFWFAKGMLSAFDAETDFLANDMRVRLHLDAFTPNQDTMDYVDDLASEVAGANGYITDGEALGTKTNINTLNVVSFGAANTVWTSSGAGFTARRATLADQTPATDATRPLYCWLDFGQDETASGGGTFTIAWSGGDIATITPADAAGFP